MKLYLTNIVCKIYYLLVELIWRFYPLSGTKSVQMCLQFCHLEPLAMLFDTDRRLNREENFSIDHLLVILLTYKAKVPSTAFGSRQRLRYGSVVSLPSISYTTISNLHLFQPLRIIYLVTDSLRNPINRNALMLNGQHEIAYSSATCILSPLSR